MSQTSMEVGILGIKMKGLGWDLVSFRMKEVFLACRRVGSHTNSKTESTEMEVHNIHKTVLKAVAFTLDGLFFWAKDKGSWPLLLSGPNPVLLSLLLHIQSQLYSLCWSAV